METRNLIGYNYLPELGNKFKAVDPALGVDLPGEFYAASISEADAAVNLADKAFNEYRTIGSKRKATFLRSIADELKAISDAIVSIE